MPRRVPSYRLHKASNPAVVTLCGKDFYLGEHGSTASHEKYARLVAEWSAAGCKLPPITSASNLTVSQVLAAYLAHAETYYVKDGDPTSQVGLACRYSIGRVLPPEEFSGGEAPGQANFVLRKLSFTVVRKGEAPEEEELARKDWSEDEVNLLVADYFAMLEKELFGKPCSKAEHRRSLSTKLDDRSEPSIEFEHANVSAVLTGMGLP